LVSGELRGLMQLRDEDLPRIYDQLGEFVSKAVDQINAAHNDATAYPPPASLVGRNTGLDLPTAVSNFTGTTTLAVVNAAGALQRSVAINFTAGTISVNGGAANAFTPANFLTNLNTALAGVGSATFTNGVLTLNATGGNGLALDEGTSDKAGRGFSHYFGLNDLINTTGFANYATGLTGADPHGFTPGGQIALRLSHPDGRPIRDLSVTVPAGATMNDLLSALNNNATGVGLYGAFSLDSDGVLSFAGSAPLQARLSIITDNTQRGATGPSISQLFGLGVRERSARADRFEVAQALNSDPNKVAMGKLDLSAALGQIAIRPGDGQGGLALSTIGEVATRFQAAGALGKVTMNLSRYAAELGGAVGRGAAAAETRKASAESVFREATNRRQSVEGVNIDEELINLTTYQQAFNASARMVQAASDLFEVLVNMV
jgi:flagellar hook-associated protein 1 FlgK